MYIKMRFTHPLLVPQQKEGSSYKSWRNRSHSEGKGCREEQRQDQNKEAAEEERKQRGPGGSFTGRTDCTGTRGITDLSGSDKSGFGWRQEAAGDLAVWFVIAVMQGGTCCPHSTADSGPRTSEEGGS